MIKVDRIVRSYYYYAIETHTHKKKKKEREKQKEEGEKKQKDQRKGLMEVVSYSMRTGFWIGWYGR